MGWAWEKRSMTDKIKPIPYGVADFEALQADNAYYVDKTMFIPRLERAAKFNFLIRPRRFGKSLFLSVLQSYYDIAKKDRFEEIFHDTWIRGAPTSERNSHLILAFNFSKVNPESDEVDLSFEDYCDTVISVFLLKYKEYFNDQARNKIESKKTTGGKLNYIFEYAAMSGFKIYLLIDEYDNFANTILSAGGYERYRTLTHGEGFFRYFFNIFKGGATGSGAGLSRLFITGVSPITMDDVTSGFNIGNNVSLDRDFNAILGFTRDDVLEILARYKVAMNLPHEEHETYNLLSDWADNYKFSSKAEEKIFNTDMVLYFVNRALSEHDYPEYIVDDNIKIDYEKLRSLILVDWKLNGNFDILAGIIENGGIAAKIVKSFPLKELENRDNFVSLLYYFGLLTFEGFEKGKPYLTIPNLTVKELMYSYIRGAYKEANIFRLDFYKLSNLINEMAYDGGWEAVVDYLVEEIDSQTSIRDYIEGEKVIQTFFPAYLNVTDFFLVRTEKELNKGYADIVLEPFFAKYPECPYAYLLELKYIRRSEFSKKVLTEKIARAREQLSKYSNDEQLRKRMRCNPHGSTRIKRIILVFNGWELAYKEEVNLDP